MLHNPFRETTDIGGGGGDRKKSERKEIIDGHRCYQNGPNTPHTKENMPVHVRIRQ